jgi:hypothetical protein
MARPWRCHQKWLQKFRWGTAACVQASGHVAERAVETDANRGKWCAIGSRVGADPGASKSITCWTAYLASMASLTVDLNEEGQKYAFDIIRRPDDHNALGGVDTSGNRWKRFQITFRNR